MGNTIPPDLVTHVVSRLSPHQLWLFGSRSRGDALPDSDWDLLAVLPDDAPDALLDPATVWRDVVAKQRRPLDLITVRRSEFEEMCTHAGSLCRDVALEGLQVYGTVVPPSPIVIGCLTAVVEDLDAAERSENRLADYHVQQAAEKLAKAILTARGLHGSREHRLQILADALPPTDPWRTRLMSLAYVDRFATAFRYPGTTGRLPMARPADESRADVATLRAWVTEARQEVGVGR